MNDMSFNKTSTQNICNFKKQSKIKGNPTCASVPNGSLAGSCIEITKFRVYTDSLIKKNNAFQFTSCISTNAFIGAITFRAYRLDSNNCNSTLLNSSIFSRAHATSPSSTCNIPLNFFITNDLCNIESPSVDYVIEAYISPSGNFTMSNIFLITDPNCYVDCIRNQTN